MSRYPRPFLLLLALTLMSALVACRAAGELAATPTKTPVPLVAAGSSGPTVTPAPFFTPTPAENIDVGPDSYPPGTNPLTGLPVDDPAVLERRPLVIAVSNNPPDFTRPQAGLNAADIVYEHFTEGGVTRYAAIYLTNSPEWVGSVRSCRLIMGEITLMYDALWACSGTSVGVGERLLESPNVRWWINGAFFGEPYLVRVSDANVAVITEAPHNLFAVPEAIWSWAGDPARNFNQQPDLHGMAFRTQPPDGGSVATRVTVDYRGLGFRYVWEYDPGTGTYLRFDQLTEGDPTPYLDKLTGEQLSFDNVLLISAQEVITDIVEDASGARALEQEIWGEGPLTLFRDGMRYDGRWRRADRNDMLTFYDQSGNVLPLRPGKSFFQIVPLPFDRLTVEP